MAQTHFMNVDLDVRSSDDCTPLTNALSSCAYNLRDGHPGCLTSPSYEINDEVSDPEQVIARFCDALEHLPTAVRGLWNAATVREFNIGLEGGFHPHASEWRLSNKLLRRISALGASVGITVYAPDQSKNESHA